MAYLSPLNGLYQKYGTEKARIVRGGDYESHIGQRIMEFRLDLTTLTTTAQIMDDVTGIPANSMIEQIEIVADTAATSGGAATLTLGTIAYDRTTMIDEDGLIVTAALTSFDTTGEKTTYIKGTSGAGALVGTTTGTAPGLLVAKYTTAAYTAGVLVVRIYWRGIGTITQ